MRMFTILLLICIIFFGGVLFGSYDKEQYTLEAQQEVKKQADIETMEVTPYYPEELELEKSIYNDEDLPLIHRIAGVFEKMFVFAYDITVKILYKIAELFF